MAAETTDKYFGKFLLEILFHKNIRKSTKYVYIVLCTHRNFHKENPDYGTCKLSIETIMSESGYKRRTVQYALRDLEKRGAITTEQVLGGRNISIYRLNFL